MVDNIENEVAAVVAARAGIPVEEVKSDTRLWHDLKLGGDDFADLIRDLHEAHGVILRGHLGDYCPTESEEWWAFWWWPFNRRKTYRELTVAELVFAARSQVHVG